MNVTMPYQAFRSQSRVEFIKRKFENSFSEVNDMGAEERNNAASRCKTDFSKELKDPDLENRKICNLKSDINDPNKNEGKALVKRSPAFRREKLGCAKSLIQVSSHKMFVEPRREKISENAQGALINKVEAPDVNLWKDFKRSKTDTNLLKHFSNKFTDKEFIPKNSKKCEIPKPLVNSHNKEFECDIEKKTLDQYSVVNKMNNKADKNEVVNLRFSESIRRALQSPLPKGPPPKKPPRTFCHAPSFTSSDPLSTISSTSTSTATVSTKVDIPKLKSKLEKLEKVVRIHEAGTLSEKTKNDFDEPVKKIPMKLDCSSIPGVIEKCQSCLPVLQYMNQEIKISSFKNVSKAKSEFYLDIEKADSNTMELKKHLKCFVGSMNDRQKTELVSSEAIYDLPCLSKKNSFETFGKCSKDLKDSVNTKKAEALHYMCTDVISQTPNYPNFLSNTDDRNNTEKKGLSDFLSLKSNLAAPEECSQGHMSRGHGLKKPVNCLKEEKRIQKNKKQNCIGGKESNEESESDLMTVNFSDCNDIKKKCELEEETLSCKTAERKIYANRVSSKLMSQISCWESKSKNSYKHLFECCLLVGLTLCESKESVPYIKSIFPPNTKPPPLIESLCFPDACYWPPTSDNNHPEEQCYSLVVTNENGERKFGYCRRVLPEGGHVCLPLAYCIISPHRAGGFFYKVLEELESRHGSPVTENFIKQLYESEFPGPGERLKLKEILEEATKSSQLDPDSYSSLTLVRRPPDVRLEEKYLTQLFRHLQLPVFLKVFSSLLLERKVLLLSCSLRNLSSCIEALQSILLPFSWQHTYIPLLPVHLIEMCEAPTPYVIGLLKPRNVEKSLTNVNFEDGILVDLDDSKILRCCGDEGNILPSRLIRDLKTSLNLAISADSLSESDKSVLISDAFIRFFVQVCGNYSKFIQSFPNGEKVFQKDEFIKSVTSNATQSFLDWFTETAMFNSFIQERLQGEDEDTFVKLFTRRAVEYSEDSLKDSAVLLKNYRVINKKVKTLGGKIKDFTSFAKQL